MNGQRSANLLAYDVSELAQEAAERCASALLYEEGEDFAKARESLGFFYAADEALLIALPETIRAEVLLRTGSLLRRVADRNRIEDDLEKAKNYLFAALELFRKLDIKEKVAESLITLASTYYNAGDYVRCRHLLNEPVFDELSAALIRANRLYLLAIVARAEKMYEQAISLYREAVSFSDEIARPALTCKYYGGLALALLFLGERDGNVDCINEALLYFTLSSQQAEESGNIRHAGHAINNLGFILFRHNRYSEAHEQLGRARRLFEKLHDISCIAQVDETRAQVLNAQGHYHKAIPLLRRSIQTFEITGQANLQADALLTLSFSLAEIGETKEAENCAERATKIFSLNEVAEGEGRAQLALAELLASHHPPQFDKLLKVCLRAMRLLGGDKDSKISARLDEVEKRVLELSGQGVVRELPKIVEGRQPAAWWGDGLSLDEAKARLEEWYLARLILERGTLEAMAEELNLSAEGVRKKLERFPHLQLLRRAMRDSNVAPLNSRKPTSRLLRIRLKDEDGHLVALGPRGGDLLAAKTCKRLCKNELGVIECGGAINVGYYDETVAVPTLNSGHEDYPPLSLPNRTVRVIGRIVGYWRKGEETQTMRMLKKP